VHTIRVTNVCQYPRKGPPGFCSCSMAAPHSCCSSRVLHPPHQHSHACVALPLVWLPTTAGKLKAVLCMSGQHHADATHKQTSHRLTGRRLHCLADSCTHTNSDHSTLCGVPVATHGRRAREKRRRAWPLLAGGTNSPYRLPQLLSPPCCLC
jgi:hypothetical protein